jgi:hypothetical protein
MDNNRKWKSFTASDEINIQVQAEAHFTVETFSAHTKQYCEEPQID